MKVYVLKILGFIFLFSISRLTSELLGHAHQLRGTRSARILNLELQPQRLAKAARCALAGSSSVCGGERFLLSGESQEIVKGEFTISRAGIFLDRATWMRRSSCPGPANRLNGGSSERIERVKGRCGAHFDYKSEDLKRTVASAMARNF